MRKRIASFGYAFEGLAVMLRTQPNAWIHSCATLLVVGLGRRQCGGALLCCGVPVVVRPTSSQPDRGQTS